MKNYFKKFSVMFVMALAIIGFGAIHNCSVAKAANINIGEALLVAPDGYSRYQTDNSLVTKNGFQDKYSGNDEANDHLASVSASKGATMSFSFYGKKLILRGYLGYIYSAKVNIDGIDEDTINMTNIRNGYGVIYERDDLYLGTHSITITNLSGTTIFDSIDVDGNLTKYTEPSNNKVITLDKTSMDLTKGESKQLIATTTPAGLDVVWSSSDESIATVDSTGNVTGLKEGQATITAKIKGTDRTDTCIVTVGKNPPPVDPEPIGDGKLFIELVDGNIKQYDVDESKINDFIKWFNNRDNDDSQSPYFKFTSKDGYKDYVVHDKIDWFEVR